MIAFGTAGYPQSYSENGNVVVGTQVFLHNNHPNGENADSNWQDGTFDTIIDSGLESELFNAITVIETMPISTVMDRFVGVSLNPASAPRLLARYDYVALGAVNVTNYLEYSITDAATLKAYSQANNGWLARSLETTHGLIRVQSGETPFLFVSAITDRVGHFDEEVTPRTYAQNTAAAHNGGIVVAWMLAKINSLFI